MKSNHVANKNQILIKGTEDPATLILELIKGLPLRTRNIIIKRFGLDGSRKQTLEEIGRKYQITRERVRQIERSTLNHFKDSGKIKHIGPIEIELEALLLEHGSIMEHELLLDKYTSRKELADKSIDNVIEFVLELSDKFIDFGETEELKRAWALEGINTDATLEIINAFIEILEAKKQALEEEKVIQHILEHVIAKKHKLSDYGVIVSHLHLSKRVLRNPFGEWGLNTWSDIVPRGVKDKAYLVLKKSGSPLHFVEITKKINEIGFNKRAIPQTVHNELIKDSRFVLVGRGIYALAEWGYKAGTVSDIIEELLGEAKKPLVKDQILAEVLKQRLVKKNTVVLALQNKDRFKKIAGGYALAK